MIIITVFKVLRVEKITKGWSPGHLKQEVSKMKRVQLRTLIKGWGGKPAESLKRKQQNLVSESQVTSLWEEGVRNCQKLLRVQVNNRGVIGDICKSTFDVAVEDKSSNEADLRANRREGETRVSAILLWCFSVKGAQK